MPRRNNGTLLENIALVAAARACLRRSGDLQFMNSFAMPPQTPWTGDDKGMLSNARLAALRVADLDDDPAFEQLFVRCANQEVGPNGALLVSLLAAIRGASLRAWINDYEGDLFYGHYHRGGGASQLTLLGQRPSELLGYNWNPASLDYTPGKYPGSVAAGESSLATTMANWPTSTCSCRLGYLDPDVHSNADGDTPRTTDHDTADWMCRLLQGHPQLAVHVHFSSNSMIHAHKNSLLGLAQVAEGQGFKACILGHAPHAVMLAAAAKSGNPGGILIEIVTEVFETWRRWPGFRTEPSVIYPMLG